MEIKKPRQHGEESAQAAPVKDNVNDEGNCVTEIKFTLFVHVNVGTHTLYTHTHTHTL